MTPENVNSNTKKDWIQQNRLLDTLPLITRDGNRQALDLKATRFDMEADIKTPEILFTLPMSNSFSEDIFFDSDRITNELWAEVYRYSAMMHHRSEYPNASSWMSLSPASKQRKKHSWLLSLMCKFFQYALLFILGVVIACLISEILGVFNPMAATVFELVTFWWWRIVFCIFLMFGLAVIIESTTRSPSQF